MAYTVLARRYRSNTFDEVVGQNHVAQTLKKAIASGRIAHAYLFCGTRGIGKTSMARILAKALNCEKATGPTTDPCCKCPSCLAIARGEDIDVIEIDAASNTQVDRTREVILDNAQYRPARSRFKIYIIDEVHMLSKASFNALLKTLEEPPEHVKFILATTEPEKILPTILSRCQRYDFRNIPTREIAEHLKNICKDEKIKADDDALILVAKAGAGSMRDSLSLLDRLLSVGEKHLTAQTIEQLLGLPRSESILQLAQAIGEARVKDVLTQADRLISEGLTPDGLIVSLIDHLRNLLILRTCGPDSNLVEVAGVSVTDLAKQAQSFDPIVLTQDITILEELRRQLRSSTAGRALLDATLVRLALAAQFTSISDLLCQITDPSAQKKKPDPVPLESKTGKSKTGTGTVFHPVSPSAAALAERQVEDSSPIPPADTSSADDDDDLPRPGKVWQSSPSSNPPLRPRSPRPPSNIEPVDSSNLPAVWQNLLRLIQDRNAPLHSLLTPGRLVAIDDNQAVIRYAADQDTFPKLLGRNGKKEQVSDFFTQILGRPTGVRFELDAATDSGPPIPHSNVLPSPQTPSADPSVPRPMPPMPPPAPRLTNEQRQELGKAPLIHALIRELDATILKLADD
ncbi:MAG: DNA polymerase III subunit gamma/tau [Planctomycetota bacterium]|nr:DNA polymerase III subunit gamma/tau [Planctomycetota bacterium]